MTRKYQQIFCVNCWLNSTPNCRRIPECPNSKCEACGEQGHDTDTCPVMAQGIICKQCGKTPDVCAC